MKSALVHYWLVNRRGGEAVLEAIARTMPNSDLFTNVLDRSMLFGALRDLEMKTSFINSLPLAKKVYPAYLPLMPMALEALDLSDYELIVSSESGPAKWVIPSPGAPHICYCHTPMRYLWDQRTLYMNKLPAPLRPAGYFATHGLRQSDVLSANRVTHFVANSSFVQKRIKQYYRRDSEVIFPPIDVDEFSPAEPEDFYLCAGQIVSYKRVDLAIEACKKLGRRLIVAGGGNTAKLQKMAGPDVEFLGLVDRATLKSLMARCRALLFPGLEDFGIIPVEVMAAGRPVIAYGQGGALDTVKPGVSGLHFQEQTVDALCAAMIEFERGTTGVTPESCRQHAMTFSRENFEHKFKDHTARVMSDGARLR